MRVLYVLRYYPTISETFVHQEISSLQRRGHDVAIAALGSRPDGRIQTELPRVPVLEVPRRAFVRRTPTRGQEWLARHQRPKDVERLPWLLGRAQEFDRLHVHFAGEAAEVAHALHLDLGVAYSVTVHGADLFRPRPSLHETLAGADAVLTIADHHVRHLAALGITAHRVRCGPDLDRLVPSPLPDGPLRFVAVGRNVPKKGFRELLSRWPREDHLTLVSDWTESPPSGVTVTGLLPWPRVLDEIQRAHALVLPCRHAEDGDMDGVPLVLMEALALGRPVITTAISGIPELVDDEVGWLLPPDDPEALESALQSARNRDARAERGAGGPTRLRSRGFTLADQVARLLAAWGA